MIKFFCSFQKNKFHEHHMLRIINFASDSEKMKIRLQTSQPTDEEYLMIGLSSSLKDYQLSYYLNKHFQTFFKKMPDIPFYDKHGEIGQFAFYHFYDEDLRMDYYLFANKSSKAMAVSAHPHFEFFVLFKLSSYQIPVNEILKEMRMLPHINAALQIPLQKLKNLDELLEDLELHLLSISSAQKKCEARQWLWQKCVAQNKITNFETKLI